MADQAIYEIALLGVGSSVLSIFPLVLSTKLLPPACRRASKLPPALLPRAGPGLLEQPQQTPSVCGGGKNMHDYRYC